MDGPYKGANNSISHYRENMSYKHPPNSDHSSRDGHTRRNIDALVVLELIDSFELQSVTMYPGWQPWALLSQRMLTMIRKPQTWDFSCSASLLAPRLRVSVCMSLHPVTRVPCSDWVKSVLSDAELPTCVSPNIV